MVSSLILAYFLHQFVAPVLPVAPDEFSKSGQLIVEEVATMGLFSVPRGAQRIELLRLRLHALCDDDVSIHGISIHRIGAGSTEDIARVYAMSDVQRLTRGYTIPARDGIVHLTMRRMVLPACQERLVSIMVDFSSDAQVGGEHRFTLESIDADVPVIYRKGIRTMPIPAGQITAGPRIGEIAVTFLRLVKPVSYGAKRTVARIQLSADAVSHHRIYAVTFTNDGSARNADLQYLSLISRGRPVTKIAEHMEGNRVRLIFDPPLILEKNKTRLLELRADIRASRSRTIRFVIEEPSDIEAEQIDRLSR